MSPKDKSDASTSIVYKIIKLHLSPLPLILLLYLLCLLVLLNLAGALVALFGLRVGVGYCVSVSAYPYSVYSTLVLFIGF